MIYAGPWLVQADYKAAPNKTDITKWLPLPVHKQTQVGLVLLRMATSSGQLSVVREPRTPGRNGDEHALELAAPMVRATLPAALALCAATSLFGLEQQPAPRSKRVA